MPDEVFVAVCREIFKKYFILGLLLSIIFPAKDLRRVGGR